MSNRLLETNSRLVDVALDRVSSLATVERRGGGKLVVPAGSTYTVETGETVRFESVEVNGTLQENGTLIVETEDNIENKYGKLSDERAGRVLIENVRARRMYPLRRQMAQREGVRGGSRQSKTPDIAFPLHSDVQTDDRVTFPDGEEYELQALRRNETHLQYAANKITP